MNHGVFQSVCSVTSRVSFKVHIYENLCHTQEPPTSPACQNRCSTLDAIRGSQSFQQMVRCIGMILTLGRVETKDPCTCRVEPEVVLASHLRVEGRLGHHQGQCRHHLCVSRVAWARSGTGLVHRTWSKGKGPTCELSKSIQEQSPRNPCSKSSNASSFWQPCSKWDKTSFSADPQTGKGPCGRQ